MTLCLALLLAVGGFFDAYPKDANATVDFIGNHREIREILVKTMSDDVADMAIAIVAPEISQYSSVTNFAQQRSLSLSYILYGRGDFSVGRFQMKPSFAEAVEKTVASDRELKTLHPKLYFVVAEDADEMTLREQRHDRLERLSSLEWQCRYLAAFISIVEKQTGSMTFSSEEERLRYWATLYNAGLNRTASQVAAIQKKKQFPRFGNVKFNYADVAVEFYRHLKR